MIDKLFSAVWQDMRQNDISIAIFDETRYKAKDTNAMYNLVDTFLFNSMPYIEVIPKSDLDGDVILNGHNTDIPPVLMISDKQHNTITITPAYYLKKDENIIDYIELKSIHAFSRDDFFIQSDGFIQPKTYYSGTHIIQFIPCVLMVRINNNYDIKFIQNQMFYDWLNNRQWQSFFNLEPLMPPNTGRPLP